MTCHGRLAHAPANRQFPGRMISRLMTGALRGAIRFYQLTLAYFFVGACRYEPSCSRYTYEAIERFGRTRLRPELARAHLLYGEWLRRENRRVDARVQLRAAHDQFASIGMEGFADRARAELQVTGEKVRKRAVETRDDLTAQERQIALLAADGLSNPEIGAQLFLSPRTVEWHLHNVFRKLGIRSRRELADVLGSSASQLAQA